MTEPKQILTPGETEYPVVERYAVLAASVLGSSMAFVNGTAVALALDPIQLDLDASLGEILWVANIYMVFMAALILIGGALGDFFGRRAVFAWGVGIFAVASLFCGLSPSSEMLTAARAMQGVGAALLTPMSLTLIADAFTKKSRGMAMGIWSAASALMTAVGPPLGGILAENVSWRWVFYMHIPLGLLALAITLFLTKAKPPPRKPESLDILGAFLAFTGFAGISYGLITLSETSERSMFSLQSVTWLGPIIIGVLALAWMIRVERKAATPMLPLELFQSGMFNAINVVTLLLYGAMGGIFVFYPIVLKDAYGLGVDETGIAFLGFVAPMAIITIVSGYLMKRFGVRLMLSLGSAICGIAFYSMCFIPAAGTISGAFISMLIFGIGMALVVPAMTTAIFNATPEESHGSASGVNNAAGRAGTLFFVAAYGAIVGFAFDLAAGPEARLAGYGSGEELTGAALIDFQDAMVTSFEALVLVSIGVMLACVIVSAFFISETIERGSFRSQARHIMLGFLRLFSSGPSREKEIEKQHPLTAERDTRDENDKKGE
ncbi:MAG: MFS transporter [Aquisalinus sp.]|nr:MFS transporter [Aquisalinus sp.]